MLKNPKEATFTGMLLGTSLTHKHLILRIVLSIACGIILPLLVNVGANTPMSLELYLAVGLFMALVTYFLGYCWACIPIIQRELKEAQEENLANKNGLA